jgi:hypothetical protein
VLALVDAAVQRQDDLRNSEAAHQREVAALRYTYEDKLRDAESRRLDAIGAVDVDAVGRAATAAAAQAATLAAQVVASAEALRTQVEQTRIQFATTLSTGLEPIQKDIADLRRVQYEQQGQKAATVDTTVSRTADRNLTVALVGLGITFGLGVFGLLIAAAGVAVAVILG